MTSTYSTNKAIEEPANGDYVNTWSTPVNSNFNIIDKAFGGHLIINATGVSGTTALTTTQYQNLYILFSGTLSANVNYQVPSGVGGQWVVYNGTSGAFTLTLSSGGGGSSVTITQGTRTLIVSDGTNVTLSVNTVTSPGGADTSIQFNQSGVFGGSSNLAWNYGTNTLTVTGAANVNGTINAYYTGKSGLLINEDSSSNVFINQQDNGPLILNTNNTERMRITAAGNVGIGTSAPGQMLTVNGTGSFAGAVSVGSMSTSGAVSAGSLTLTTALTAANGGTGLTSAGTSGNVLTSNGSAWVSSAPASPPQIQTQILTVGTGTWTAPTGVTKVYVAVVGGGGGANNTYNGGSGGIAIGEYTVSPGTGYAYTVGAGGAGINTGGTANAGGSSSFASFASATGGGAANPTSGTGADGTGTGGTLRNTSTLWTGLSTPMGGYQTTGAATNAASNWGIGSLSQAGAFGYTSAGVGLGGNSGGIYLMWVG